MVEARATISSLWKNSRCQIQTFKTIISFNYLVLSIDLYFTISIAAGKKAVCYPEKPFQVYYLLGEWSIH